MIMPGDCTCVQITEGGWVIVGHLPNPTCPLHGIPLSCPGPITTYKSLMYRANKGALETGVTGRSNRYDLFFENFLDTITPEQENTMNPPTVRRWIVQFDLPPSFPGSRYWVGEDLHEPGEPVRPNCTRSIPYVVSNHPTAVFETADAAANAASKYGLSFAIVPVYVPPPLPEPVEIHFDVTSYGVVHQHSDLDVPAGQYRGVLTFTERLA